MVAFNEQRDGKHQMRNAFNIVMRIVSTLLGVLLVCMGGVWILQGLDLAFKVGFMVGDKHWVVYGAILALVGVAQIVWSNTRQA
jgi:drug/metabolite transporter superfamily protein YnfA